MAQEKEVWIVYAEYTAEQELSITTEIENTEVEKFREKMMSLVLENSSAKHFKKCEGVAHWTHCSNLKQSNNERVKTE